MNQLRIAVAGAGAIGLRHIEEIEKSRSSHLSAIVDVSAKAPELARKAGVPLYASLADTLAEGIRLCEAAEKAGVKLLVGHHRIHSPILHKACAVIRSGILGPLVRARDGLQNLRVVEAIAEAAKTGRIVETNNEEGSIA